MEPHTSSSSHPRIPRNAEDCYRTWAGIRKSLRTAGMHLLLILTRIFVYMKECIFIFLLALKTCVVRLGSGQQQYYYGSSNGSLGHRLGQEWIQKSGKAESLVEVRVRAVLYGLARSGRTSLLLRMKLDDFLPTLPTVAAYCEKFSVPVGTGGKSASFQIWDCDRKDRVFTWRAHRTATDAVIFVIDSSQKQQVTEARDELMEFMFEESYNRTSTRFAILANKQDVHGALTPSEIQAILNMPTQLRARWKIFGTSAVTGRGVDEVAEWLALTAENGDSLLVGHEMAALKSKLENMSDGRKANATVDVDRSRNCSVVAMDNFTAFATSKSTDSYDGGERNGDGAAIHNASTGTARGMCEYPQRHWRRTLSQLSSSSSQSLSTTTPTSTDLTPGIPTVPGAQCASKSINEKPAELPLGRSANHGEGRSCKIQGCARNEESAYRDGDGKRHRHRFAEKFDNHDARAYELSVCAKTKTTANDPTSDSHLNGRSKTVTEVVTQGPKTKGSSAKRHQH